jgi:hypothetical protein
VARIGQLFGGRTRDVVDRDGDGVDDRLEANERKIDASKIDTHKINTAADRDRDGVDDRVERTDTIPAVGVLDRDTGRDTDRDGIADRRESPTHRLAADGSTSTVMQRSIDRDAPVSPVSPAPGTAPDIVPVRQAPARASLMATFGVVFGVAGVAVALTGLLAPWAIAVGAVGLLLSFGGVIAGARPNVAGRGLGTLGVLINGTAMVFGILAVTGQVSWLDSDVDQVARLNEWLDARLPWMKDW